MYLLPEWVLYNIFLFLQQQREHRRLLEPVTSLLRGWSLMEWTLTFLLFKLSGECTNHSQSEVSLYWVIFGLIYQFTVCLNRINYKPSHVWSYRRQQCCLWQWAEQSSFSYRECMNFVVFSINWSSNTAHGTLQSSWLMSKTMFQLYWSSLSAKYEDVDQGNVVGEQQSEEQDPLCVLDSEGVKPQTLICLLYTCPC